MRVLIELRGYLDARGLLSAEDLKRLDETLFWRDLELVALHHESDEEPERDDVEEDPLWSEWPPADRPRRSRRAHHGRSSTTLSAASLVLRLAERLQALSPRLEGIRLLASRTAPCRTWQDASIVLDRADTERVDRDLRALLERGGPIRLLWDVLALDPSLDAVLPEERGPAVRAYRVLVESPHFLELRRHHWLLRHAAVRDACILARARRLLFASCRRLYQEDPANLWRVLARDRHPLAFWTLVLLHNARRAIDASAAPRVREFGPLRRAPDPKTWEQAWAHALLFESGPVSRLLQLCPRVGALPPLESLPTLSLMCPVEWHQGGR